MHNRYSLVGPIVWLLSVQYYLTQLIVSLKFQNDFSWLHNTISDLGNTVCGQYGARYVCSPLHGYMNASFLALGTAMIVGSALLWPQFRPNRWAGIGFWCLMLAGAGTILVGVFPENTVADLHVSGAALAFSFGNLALLIFSFSLGLPAVFKWYTRLSGVVALTALVLFLSKTYGDLDIGGMERFVAYPQSMWLILFGAYQLARPRSGRSVVSR